MSSEEVKDLKERVDIVDVIGNFVDLRQVGKVFIGACPIHGGSEESTAFKVYPDTQRFHCYSCGKGSDVIGFLKEMGNTYKDTISMLKGEAEMNGEFAKEKLFKPPVAKFKYLKPKKRFPEQKYEHDYFGKPEDVYEYYDIDNKFIGSNVRYSFKGKKVILPFNTCVCVAEGYEKIAKKDGKYVPKGKYYNVGEVNDMYCGFPEPKPIFMVEIVKDYDGIIIVEGEKTCRSVNRALAFNPDYLAICWYGGTNSADKVDWSVIKDKEIYIVPDNDWSHTNKCGDELPKQEQPGIKAMIQVKDRLAANNKVFWVNTYDRGKPCGWDWADTNWNEEEILDFIQNNLHPIK